MISVLGLFLLILLGFAVYWAVGYYKNKNIN
jgi:hypothetical protein